MYWPVRKILISIEYLPGSRTVYHMYIEEIRTEVRYSIVLYICNVLYICTYVCALM